MNKDVIRKIYDAMSKEYDMAEDFNTFSQDIQNKDVARRVYDAMYERYRMEEDFDEFYKDLSSTPIIDGVKAPESGSVVVDEPQDSLVQRIGKVMQGVSSPSALTPTNIATPDGPELTQEEKDQRAAMRQLLQEDGTIDRMKEAKKEARREKLRAFGNMLGSTPQVSSFGVSTNVFDSTDEQLADVGQALDAGTEYRQNKLLQEKLDVALDMARAGENQDGLRGVENFGLGLWDSATRLSTWDFGASDIVNNFTLQQIVEKWENDPSSLTATEQKVLDGIGMATAVQELYSDQVGIGYNVGQSLPESAGFMASMALNPASGLGKSLARNAVRTYGRNSIAKNLARIGGDIAETAIMTATTGAGRVAADALERINGSSTYEIGENGVIMYGGQKDQETVGNAVIKAIGANFIENYSEALGEYFDPLLGMSRKVAAGGLRKMNLNKWADALSDVQPSQMTASIRALREKTKFGGIFGEVMEEEIGMALNAISGVGDYTFSKEKADEEEKQWIFDLENQLTTVLSCAIMSGTLNGVEQVSSVAARRRMEKNAKNAEQEASYRFPRDEFAPLREAIDQASPEGMVDVLRDVYMSQEYTVGQKRALAEYAAARLQLQYYNATDAKARRQVNKTQQELLDAQEAGLNAQLPQFFNIARAAQFAEDELLDYDGDFNLVDIIRSSINRPEEMERILGDLPPREAQLVTNYIYSRARMEGAYQGRSNRAEDYIDDFAYALEPAVVTGAEGNRTITTALLGDRSVYVLENNGDLAHIMRPDGSKTLVKASELTNITTSSAEEVIDRYRDMYTFEYNAETENAFEHHPKTQAPQVGLQLQSPEGEVVITAVNDNMVEIVPAVYKDGQVQPKEGAEPQTITVDDAYMWQDSYYQGLDDAAAATASQPTVDNMSAETTENEGTPTEEIDQSVSEEVTDGQNATQPTETESVAPVAPAAPQTARERVPKDDKGNPIYEQTDADTAWDAIVEETEGDTEMAQRVAADMLEDKKAALAKLQNGKPKKGATVAEKIANEKAHAAAIAQEQNDVAQWEAIVGTEARRREAAMSEADRYAAEMEQKNISEGLAALGEPQSLEEYVLGQLAGGSYKLRWSDKENGTKGFGSHTGLSTEEMNARLSMIDNKNGLTPEEIAHSIVENMDASFGEVDVMDVTNMVIDAVATNASRRAMLNGMVESRAELMRQQARAEQEAKDAWYMEQYHATEEELTAYKEYLAEFAEEIYGEDTDYEQRIATFAEIQLEYDNQGTDAGLRSSADQGEGLASDREGSSSVGETEQLDRRELREDAAGVAETEDGRTGSSISAESDAERIGAVKAELGVFGADNAAEYANRLYGIYQWKSLEEANEVLRAVLRSYDRLSGQTLGVLPYLDQAQKLIKGSLSEEEVKENMHRTLLDIGYTEEEIAAAERDQQRYEADMAEDAAETVETLENGDVRRTNLNSNGEIATVVIERDGNVISVDSYDEGVLFEHTDYDENGNATRVVRYNKDGEVVSEQEYKDGKRNVTANVFEMAEEAQKKRKTNKKKYDKQTNQNLQEEESKSEARGVRNRLQLQDDQSYESFIGRLKRLIIGYKGTAPTEEVAKIIREFNNGKTLLARTEQERELLKMLRVMTNQDIDYVLSEIEDVLSSDAINDEDRKKYEDAVSLINKFKNRGERKAIIRGLTGAELGDKLPLTKIDELFEMYNSDEDVAELYGRVRFIAEQIGLDFWFDDNMYDEQTGGYLDVDNRVRLNAHMLYSPYVTQQEKASAIVHEMLHAVADYAIKTQKDIKLGLKPSVQLPKQVLSAANSILNIYEKVVRDNPLLVHEEYDPVEDAMKVVPDYGTSSAREMLMEIANPEFREKLKQIEYDGRSVWQRIWDAIRSMFIKSSDVTNRTAYDSMAKALDVLINEFSVDAYQKYSGLEESEHRVYHGSGALFDKFDHSFMGTGEGNRAFGWGTYVSEAEGVGKTYAKIAAKPSLTYKGQEVSTDGYENPWRVIKDLYDMSRGKITQMRADAEKHGRLAEEDSPFKPIWGEIVAILKNARRGDIKVTPRRMLYEVEIPDDNGSNYLEWYDVVDRKNEIRNRLYERLAEGQGETYKTELKQELYDVFRFSDNNGRTLYKNISAYLSGDKAASQFLHEMGYVGIKYPTNTLHGGNIDGTSNYVIFNEDDLDIVDNLRFRDGAPFFSNAERAVENIKQNKATPEQWLAMIKKDGGLKAGEDKWMGLSDWLNEQKEKGVKTLTKDEVLAYIRENQIEIEEVEYREEASERYIQLQDEFSSIVENIESEYSAAESKMKQFDEEMHDKYGDGFYYMLNEKERNIQEKLENALSRGENPRLFAYEDMISTYGDDFKAALEVDYRGRLVPTSGYNGVMSDEARHYLGINPINSTRLDYTTAGLENKREIALVVPTIEPWNQGDEIHFGDAGDGRAVAWVRFGETTDEDGNRVLVIDEVQSKRHDEGRAKGYSKHTKREEFRRLVDEMYDKYGANFHVKMTRDEEIEFDRLTNERIREDENNNSAVPDAPFDKNYHELVMKRMLRYAAENGFDKVAWTKGAQQAERYDLSNTVSSIEYKPLSNGHYSVTAYGTNGYPIGNIPSVYNSEQEIADVFGKEMAVKIVQGVERARQSIAEYKESKEAVRAKMREVDEDSAEYEELLEEFASYDKAISEARSAQTIEDEDLQIGGDGMKGFYDEMIPRFMNKYTKKWGTKVGEVTLPNVEEAGRTMWSVDVTPEMRESVMQGQPMFREGEGAISDREVSYENDPIAKFMGKPRYYGKRAAAFAERERRRMENAAKEAAEMLGIEAEIITDASTLQGRKSKAKGWYDIVNKKVVVVVPNHVSMGDAVRTVLHEGIAHHGLRELFGDGFDAMLDNVYNNVSPELKARIDAIAERTGVSTSVATEEYMASLAETTNFEEAQRRGWWQQIKSYFVDMLRKLSMPGLKLKEEITDNELRYLLWRSYKNLVEPNSYLKPMGYAEDVVKQKELKVGEYAEKTQATPMAADTSEAEEWAAVTMQRIEELEAQAAQLENEIAEMEADRDADDASRYEMWEQQLEPLRKQMEDVYAELEGLYSLEAEAEEMSMASEDAIRYRLVDDPAEIERLESEPTIKAYRAMQVINGELYPPMSAVVDGKLREPIALGQWEQSEERPDLADDKGRFKLDKGNKKSLKAAYNPYFHSSSTPLNDQFSEAQDRDNLVTVEVEIPVSEADGTSGYKAEKAKDAVGTHQWKAGIIQGQLTGTREVFLTRWDKPMRIVPESEVADVIVEMFDGKNIVMPSNVVTPQLRKELEARGITFVETDNQGKLVEGENKGKHYSKVYGKKADGLRYREGDDTKLMDALADAYASGDAAAIQDAVNDIMDAIRIDDADPSIGNLDWEKVENYNGTDPRLLAAQYIVRAQHHLYLDEDYDTEYIKTGIKTVDAPVNETAEEDVSSYTNDLKNEQKEAQRQFEERVERSQNNSAKGVWLWNGLMSVEEIQERHQSLIDEFENLLSTHQFDKAADKLGEIRAWQNAAKRHIDNPYSETPYVGEDILIADIERESAALGVPVRIARSVDELPGDAETRKRAEDGSLKGVYSTRDGEVVVYLPNTENTNDAKRTILHEIVGHKGLRSLIGEQQYDKAMLQLMYMLPADVRDAVLRRAERHGWNAAIAMDEYLAEQAERDVQPTWWGKVNAKIRALLRNLGFDVKLTDADVTYLLWRSRKKLQGDDLNDMAVNAILKQAARKSAEADAWNEQAFKDAEMRDFERNTLPSIRHRMGADTNDYEKTVRTLGFKQAEAWQDHMRSLLVFQRALAKESGKDISDFENAYMYENRMSSANLMEMEQYRHMVYNPLLKAIHELEQMGASRESIINYLFAKSGLERNEVFARRDAKKHAEGDATKEQQLYDKYRQKDYAGLTALTRGDAQIAALVDDHSKKKTEYERLEQNKKRGVAVSDADLKAAKKEMDDARKAMITAIEAEAQRMVDEFEAQHNTDNLWDKIRNCTHTTLNISHDAGIMSDEVYNELWNQFQYYIPLRGFAETTAEDMYLYLGGNDSPYNAPIKTAYGRTSLADDPIATIGNMAESAIVEANRNRLKQRFLYMVERHNTDLASISDVWLEYDDVNDEWHTVFAQIPDDATPSEAKRLQQEFEDRMKTLAEQNPGKYANASQQPNIPYRVVKKGDRQEHHVIVKRNGKDVVITINGNPRVAQAINGLTNPEQNNGPVQRIVNWVNRNLSANFTMRNPAFMVSNFVRDGFYTNSMVWVKENPAYARQYNKNWAICTAQIASLVKRYKRYEKGDTSAIDMNNDMDRMFYEFMINGGETGYTVIKSVEDYKGLISGEMKKMEAGAMGTARRVADTIGSAVDTFGRWAEDTSRFAAYMTSRQLGRTITKSIWDAKEISVNFNKKGSGNRMMGKFEQGNRLNYVLSNMSQLGRNLYVFWNAGVQGLNNFKNAAKKSPAKFTAMAGTYFTLGVIVAAAFSGDDDEDDYYNLPEYVRRNNICFKIGKGKYATLPLPIEIRAIYGLGELAYSYLSGREGLTHGEAVTKTIQQITQVLPIDMMADGGGAMALVPSAAKPVVEVIHNVDWTGRPIYKEKTPWNQNDPTWTLAFKSTSPELVGMSRLVNEWTNKNTADGLERPYNRGWADNRYLNNPAVWEHILEGYLGGMATMFNQTKKTLMMPFNEDLREVRNVPIASRFIKDAGKEGRSYAARNEYYDAKNIMDSWKNEMSKAKKEVLDESLTDEQRLKAAKLRSSLEQQYTEAAERWKVLDRQRKALEEAYKSDQSEENRQALDNVMMQMATLVEAYRD